MITTTTATTSGSRLLFRVVRVSRAMCLAAAVCDVTMHCSAGGMRREDGSVRRQTVRSRSRLVPLKHLTLQILAFQPSRSLPVATQ